MFIKKRIVKKKVNIIIVAYFISVLFLMGFQPQIDELNKNMVEQGVSDASKLNLFSTFIKIIAFLTVLSAIAFLIYIIRRSISSEKLFPYAQSKYIRLLDVFPLGNNSKICVLSIGKKILALGVTERSIQIISVLDNDDIMLQDDEGIDSSENNFKTVLLNTLRKIRTFRNKEYQNYDYKNFEDKLNSLKQNLNGGMGEDSIDL
ncbi:MAG: hypothetical protein PWP21_1328 [Thermosediminibacterales bacterium]|nr:hypothetical protein [Thermosediminibacterales bacterium]